MRTWLASWMPSANVDAQAAHVGWGAFAVLFFGLLWGPFWAWGILAAFVCLKEFVFDLVVEKDSLADGWMDAAFYNVGGLLGMLARWLL